jgi:hypothetical protein
MNSVHVPLKQVRVSFKETNLEELARSAATHQEQTDPPSASFSGPSSRQKKWVSAKTKQYQKKKGHEKRKRHRALDKIDILSDPYHVRPSIRKKYNPSQNTTESGHDLEQCQATSSGYLGYDNDTPIKRVFSIDELVSRYGFKVMAWDGYVYFCLWLLSIDADREQNRKTTPLTDDKGRIFAVLAGHPDDPDWTSIHEDAADAMKRAREGLDFELKQTQHRRGKFAALSCGPSYGGGQTVSFFFQNLIVQSRFSFKTETWEPSECRK